ncbi:hypothetical protein [Paenibacillus senegalensis]|uniref:hypothetical protein n=1 Tax=Paenibacillus senegalensis TaxID=1465766 RepID=UPI0002884407|nr:hypothetical protein [Paenibacillus senegalensis]
MNRFIIGQFGGFDEGKYERDFRRGFYGIEACLFKNEQDLTRLMQEAERQNFQIGVHFPMRAGRRELRDALFLAADPAVRAEAFESVEQELDFLTAFRPKYILFHYPKPVILDNRVDWRQWHFDDRREYEYESAYALEPFKQQTETLLKWLTEKGRAYRFTPVLEFDGLNRYIYEDDFFEQLLAKYTDIRLCLDTLRLFLQERIDPFFSASRVLEKYARFAETVHLSNVQILDDLTIQNRRCPVLPNQNPEQGWAPIEQYLSQISRVNSSVKIVFEHRSDMVSDEELETCYQWVDKLLG